MGGREKWPRTGTGCQLACVAEQHAANLQHAETRPSQVFFFSYSTQRQVPEAVYMPLFIGGFL